MAITGEQAGRKEDVLLHVSLTYPCVSSSRVSFEKYVVETSARETVLETPTPPSVSVRRRYRSLAWSSTPSSRLVSCLPSAVRVWALAQA